MCAAQRTHANPGVRVRRPRFSVAEFERLYGPDSRWAQLFSSSDGFEGTQLVVPLSTQGRYLTVDRFRDEPLGAGYRSSTATPT